jgi:hypothetical protein
MRRTLMGAAAAGALVVTLTACSDTSAPAGTGRLTVSLTDAPFPYDQVARADMFVVRIDAQMGESSEADAASIGDNAAALTNTDPRSGWVTVATPNQSFNLLNLQHGVSASLGQITLPTGTYRSFRLVLDTRQSTVTLTDGTVLSGSSTPGIVWPSAGLTGIKVQLVQTISIAAAGTAMMLDFDLGRSFALRGSTIRQGLLFSPVIRATAHIVNSAPTVGTLAGTVTCGSEDGPGTPVVSGSIEVLKSGTDINDLSPANVVAMSSTDDAGGFRMENLAPGDYSVRAMRPDGSASCANATLVPGVVVSSGATWNIQVLLPPI